MAKYIDDFPEAFTNYVAMWNLLEMTAQNILTHVLGQSGAAMAVSVEMKNTTLTYALKAAASLDGRSPECTKAIERFVEAFERLREHRNFTAHSFVTMVDGKRKWSAGLRMLVQAKGRLKHTDMVIEASSLWEVYDQQKLAQEFGTAIVHALQGEKPWPSPDKLPLPARLEKSLRNLEPHFPPLRS